MVIAAFTDVGRQRKNNEDNYFTYHNDKIIGAMVADGMGGHNSGELASKMAVSSVKRYIINAYDPKMDYMQMAELLREAFMVANREIYNASEKGNNKGMGTTSTLAFVYERKLIVAHVGDSRCYRIYRDRIEQLTNDHSFVNELVRMGEISESDAKVHPNRNMITRALGAEASVKIDMEILPYNEETILLCSDGLTNMISDEQILEKINDNDDLDDALLKMVELANKKGGNDNITVAAFGKQKGEAEI